MDVNIQGKENIIDFSLRLTNLLNNNTLNDKELIVLSEISLRDLDISWFSKPYVDSLCTTLNMSYPAIMKVKDSLVQKGVLSQSENKNKRNIVLNDTLKLQIKYILEKRELTLSLNYK